MLETHLANGLQLNAEQIQINMTYLCILFIPPVYFITRKQWGGFFLNSVLYGIACLCVISIIGMMVAPIFWILAVGHASFAYRQDRINHHAELLASKMAEKMGRDK